MSDFEEPQNQLLEEIRDEIKALHGTVKGLCEGLIIAFVIVSVAGFFLLK
jgi:hypothetical protein